VRDFDDGYEVNRHVAIHADFVIPARSMIVPEGAPLTTLDEE